MMHDTDKRIIGSMKKSGSSFAKRLAYLCEVSSASQMASIKRAFSEIWKDHAKMADYLKAIPAEPTKPNQSDLISQEVEDAKNN